MLSPKDICHRVYEGKECVRFEVYVRTADEQAKTTAVFTKVTSNAVSENEWHMRYVTDRLYGKDCDVYNISYVMPKSGMPLEMVAATGLSYFQKLLREHMQDMSTMDYYLSVALEGM